MIGIAYLLEEEAKQVRNNIVQYCRDEEYENAFWEEALYKKDVILMRGENTLRKKSGLKPQKSLVLI